MFFQSHLGHLVLVFSAYCHLIYGVKSFRTYICPYVSAAW